MIRGPRVAIVSDTLDDTNGVAIGLRRLAAARTHAHGYDLAHAMRSTMELYRSVARIRAIEAAS